MAKPIFYYGNALAAGVLTGTSTLETNPVRRVADSDKTLLYTLITDTVGPDVEVGQVAVTLPIAATRTHFVLVSGTALSGWTLSVESEDADGGNNASHGSQAMTSDAPFVLALSGVTTARRVWRAKFTSVSGIETSPKLYEMMVAKQYQFGMAPLIGVTRTRVHNYQRLDVPGGAPYKHRLGEDYLAIGYRYTLPTTELSGFRSFLRENDGGEPFWHIDDESNSFWGELRNVNVSFDDQAGVHSFSFVVQEIPHS